MRASHDPTGFATIPLTRACDQTADGVVHDRLRLKVEYNCRLDDFGEHLAVHDSVFGLWVQADPTRKPTPVVRVEYLRTPVTPGHPPAHVHLHAESAELGWVYGTAGLAMPRLEEIHFPVGGRRFRPTIEEFLLVLDREGIFRDWGAVDWRDTVHRSLEVWEDLQVRATVRSQPGPASDQLRRMGYRVVPPPQPGEA